MANTQNGKKLPTSTLLKKTEITLEELLQSNLSKFLYLVHGTGSNRDRKMALATLRDYFAQSGSMNPIVLKDYDQGGYWKIELTGEAIEFTRNNDGTETPKKITFNVTNGLVLENTLTGSGVTRTYNVQVGTEGYSVSDSNPSGTFTAEMKGGVVRVKRGNDGSEIDYEKVTTPLLKADAIEGTSAGTGSVDAKEVIVKSGLHIKNDNGAHYLKVDGGSTFNGNVDVNGKILDAKYNITENVMSIDDDDTIIGFDDGAYAVGDILFVYNTSSSAKKVYFGSTGGVHYVEIKRYCTIPFRCVVAGLNNWEWSPLCNVDVGYVSP